MDYVFLAWTECNVNMMSYINNLLAITQVNSVINRGEISLIEGRNLSMVWVLLM